MQALYQSKFDITVVIYLCHLVV